MQTIRPTIIRLCVLIIGLAPIVSVFGQGLIQLPRAGQPGRITSPQSPVSPRQPQSPKNAATGQPLFQQALLPPQVTLKTNLLSNRNPGPALNNTQTNAGPKDVNVDTVLAKFLETQGDFSAFGDMEIRRTNNTGKADYQHFPFTFSVLEGRIRTELDLRNVPKKFDGSGGLSALRQIGIGRIVSVTLPQLRSVHVIFPSAESYVSKSLEIEDSPGSMRIEKSLAGREQLNGRPFDKYACNLDFISGDKVPVEMWQVPGATNRPVFLRIHQTGSSVTVRFRIIRPGKIPEELFDTPKEFSKYADMGYLMQAASARHEASQSGRPVRSRPQVIMPNRGGSFLNGR